MEPGCSDVRVHVRPSLERWTCDRQPDDRPTPAAAWASEPFGRAPQPGNTLGFDDSVYQRLLRERIIFLGSVVDDSIANALSAQMLLLAAEDPDKDIYLYINSPGGSVSAGMALYDTMQYVPSDVATIAMGLAASMGQFLLCAGHEASVTRSRTREIMMHQPSGGNRWNGLRHQDSGRAAALHQEEDG